MSSRCSGPAAKLRSCSVVRDGTSAGRPVRAATTEGWGPSGSSGKRSRRSRRLAAAAGSAAWVAAPCRRPSGVRRSAMHSEARSGTASSTTRWSISPGSGGASSSRPARARTSDRCRARRSRRRSSSATPPACSKRSRARPAAAARTPPPTTAATSMRWSVARKLSSARPRRTATTKATSATSTVVRALPRTAVSSGPRISSGTSTALSITRTSASATSTSTATPTSAAERSRLAVSSPFPTRSMLCRPRPPRRSSIASVEIPSREPGGRGSRAMPAILSAPGPGR